MRLKTDLKKGYDLVIIARRPAINLDYTELEGEVDKLLHKAGLIEKWGIINEAGLYFSNQILSEVYIPPVPWKLQILPYLLCL